VTIFKQETDTLAGKVGRLQRTDCQVYIHRWPAYNPWRGK